MEAMTDASSTRPTAVTRSTMGMLRWRGGALDLTLAWLVVVLAGAAYLVLPGGSFLRLLLAVGVLFFAPGYLLIEAATAPAKRGADRAAKAWLAIGTSPAIVGIIALATAVLPGGFRAGSIVLATTVGCLGLAGIAYWRRAADARAATTARVLAPA